MMKSVNGLPTILLPNMITVASLEVVGSDTLFPNYSNYGDTLVQIAAQGYAELPAAGTDGFSNFTGTSIAAPYVARTAAMIRAVYPLLSAEQIINCIISTASFQNSMVDKVSTNGVLDHQSAMQCAASQTPPLATAVITLDGERNAFNQVALKWQYIGQREPLYYEIEQSLDGLNWQVIQTINHPQQTDFLDTNAPLTSVWYRINSISETGKSLLSAPKNIAAADENKILVFPNPLQNNTLRLQISPNWHYQPLNCTLHDVQGRILWRENTIIQTSQATWSLPTLPAGMYWLSLESDGRLVQQKVVITN